MNNKSYIKRFLTLTILIFPILWLSSCGIKGNYDYKKDGYTSIVTFNFNGGIMSNGVTDISEKIQYAYLPNSQIFAPEEFPNCEVTKNGYRLEGWYKDNTLTNKWDFDNHVIGDENIVLYAKWEYITQYYYSLVYIDEETSNEVVLYDYNVETNAKFSDYLYKSRRNGYTAMGFYADPETNVAWNPDFTHPGGEEELKIKVYVKYIKGEYTLVSNYDELVRAINAQDGIYLLNDIDCGNNSLNFGNFSRELQGNNYKISNFTVEAGAGLRHQYGIFNTLENGAKILNVKFENVTINTPSSKITYLKVAALAGNSIGDVLISNVEITGDIVIDKNLDFRGEEDIVIKLTEAIFDDTNTSLIIEDFVSNLTLVDERG